MENPNTISAEDLLKKDAAVLSNLRIPAGLISDIGLPISQVLADLNAVIQAVERGKAEMEEPEAELMPIEEEN